MLGLKRILQFIRSQLSRKGQKLGSHLTPTKTILVSSNEYLLVIGVSIQNLKKRIQIYLQYIIYCDLYPMGIIRKLKKHHWTVNSFLYCQSPWQKRQPYWYIRVVWILSKSSVSVFFRSFPWICLHNTLTPLSLTKVLAWQNGKRFCIVLERNVCIGSVMKWPHSGNV